MPKSGFNAADMEEAGNGYFLKSCFGHLLPECTLSKANPQIGLGNRDHFQRQFSLNFALDILSALERYYAELNT